jgi:hypothetical protein
MKSGLTKRFTRADQKWGDEGQVTSHEKKLHAELLCRREDRAFFETCHSLLDLDLPMGGQHANDAQLEKKLEAKILKKEGRNG